MYNIEMENTLSIKQIFELFPYSYFEKIKGIQNNGKLTPIPTEFFVKFLLTLTRVIYMKNEETHNLHSYFPPSFLYDIYMISGL